MFDVNVKCPYTMSFICKGLKTAGKFNALEHLLLTINNKQICCRKTQK
jgi:hypothetical protein